MHGRSLSVVERFVGVKVNNMRSGCRGQAGSGSDYPRIPDNPPHVFLFGGNKQAFLLNYPVYFLHFPRLMVGPPPNQSFSWTFWFYPYPTWFFSQMTLPLGVHSLAPIACPEVLLCHLVSTELNKCPAKEFPPYWVSLPTQPQSLGKGSVVPWGDSSCPLRD